MIITGVDAGVKSDKPKEEKKDEKKEEKGGPKRKRDGVLVNAYGAPLHQGDRRGSRIDERGRYDDRGGHEQRGRDNDRWGGRNTSNDRYGRPIDRPRSPPPGAVMEPPDIRKSQHCPFYTMGQCGRQSAKGGSLMTCANPCASGRLHVDPKAGTRAECVSRLEAVGIQAQRAFIAHVRGLAKGFFKGE